MKRLLEILRWPLWTLREWSRARRAEHQKWLQATETRDLTDGWLAQLHGRVNDQTAADLNPD